MIQIFSTKILDGVEYAEIGPRNSCRLCVANHDDVLCVELKGGWVCHHEPYTSIIWLRIDDALRVRLLGRFEEPKPY